MDIQSLVSAISDKFSSFAQDSSLQVEKNVKAAGARARKAALELSKMMKDFRKASLKASK